MALKGIVLAGGSGTRSYPLGPGCPAFTERTPYAPISPCSASKAPVYGDGGNVRDWLHEGWRRKVMDGSYDGWLEANYGAARATSTGGSHSAPGR